MNDPHVKSLTYRLKVGKGVLYDDPPLLQDEFSSFKMTLENELLLVEMKEHFATDSEARSVVDQVLKSWELDVALKSGYNEFTFQFVSSQIIDRNPPLPGKPIKMITNSAIYGVSSITANLQIKRKKYPPPPRTLKYSADVESLWERYQGYLKNREPILSMAYFCLTLLVTDSSGRKLAARKYRIDLRILKTLGNLTSSHGNKSEARKVDKKSTLKPLSEKERRWIEEAIKSIIRRKAEYDFDPNCQLEMITLKMLSPHSRIVQ